MNKNPLLVRALLGNATFSAITGLIALTAAPKLAVYLGVPEPFVLQIIGGLLLPYAAHLVIAARRKRLIATEIIYFCAMDAAWVVGTVVILWTKMLPLTLVGLWVLAIVALCVADFGILQYLGLRRTQLARS